ncbi:MAG: prolipoprotein diacylglyceryl transferase [Clostridia bacterium]|nr:prolipoprotein diacylglyceryl transferase [Clostridia bacterium]
MQYDSIAFTIGDFPIYWYALLVAAGIILAVVIIDIEARRQRMIKDLSLDLCIVAIPCGLIGARLLSCAFDGSIENIFSTSFDDLMLFGALILGYLGIALYAKLRKISILKTFDCLTPGVIVGIAVARWGDLFNRSGCGPKISAGWLKWIPVGMYNSDNEVCLSVFFIEFLLCVGIFLLIWLYLRRIKTANGTVFFVGSLLYCLFSIGLEALRTDVPVLWLLKANQWICIVVIVTFLSFLTASNRLKPLLNSIFKPQYPTEEELALEAQAQEAASGEQESQADEAETEEREKGACDDQPNPCEEGTEDSGELILNAAEEQASDGDAEEEEEPNDER